MSIVLTVSASRLIGTTGDGEMAGDLKRIYSATPVTAKAMRLIGTVGVDEYAADIKRVYQQGGVIVSALRSIDSSGDRELSGDLERIYQSGGIIAKAPRAINIAGDNEIKGDFLRICFVTLAHMAEDSYIILTVEQPYGIPWMENEIVHSAWCWKITRTDGVVLGFTSHDEDIEYNGVVYKASTGFAPTAVSTSGDMAVDNPSPLQSTITPV